MIVQEIILQYDEYEERLEFVDNMFLHQWFIENFITIDDNRRYHVHLDFNGVLNLFFRLAVALGREELNVYGLDDDCRELYELLSDEVILEGYLENSELIYYVIEEGETDDY